MFRGDGAELRRRGARTRRALLLVGHGQEQETGIALIGLDRGEPRSKPRLHVEKPAAGQELAALEVRKRQRVFAGAAEPLHHARQKPLRIEGKLREIAVVIGGHHVVVARQHDGAAAPAALQRQHVAARIAGDRRGPHRSDVRERLREARREGLLRRRCRNRGPGGQRERDVPRPRHQVIPHASVRS